jgi:hypothetical protein
MGITAPNLGLNPPSITMLPSDFSDIVNDGIDPARQLFLEPERLTRPKPLGKRSAFGTPARHPRFTTGGVSHLN